MASDQPVRGKDNTTLTISLSKALRHRIEEAAAADKRKVSPWCAIQLEKVLDELEAAEKITKHPELKVAEDEGKASYPSTRAAGARAVKYPQGRKGRS